MKPKHYLEHRANTEAVPSGWVSVEEKLPDHESNVLAVLDGIVHISGSVYLTENQIAELAQIGSQHLYLDEMDECRISYGGIMEILKRYEELRKADR